MQDSESQICSTTSSKLNTIKLISAENGKNIKEYDKTYNVENVPSTISPNNINQTSNIVDNDNIVNEDSNFANKTNNYFSLYNQSNTQDIVDNINGSDHDKNNDEAEYKNKNYISLYTQSEPKDINEINHHVNSSENKENNDPRKNDNNLTSLYTQSELKDTDEVDDIVSKPNSLTLGEVRQALNNGVLDDIFPMGGPVYRVRSSQDTNNIELSDNNKVNSGEIQV